jgi:hypothetical protein
MRDVEVGVIAMPVAISAAGWDQSLQKKRFTLKVKSLS